MTRRNPITDEILSEVHRMVDVLGASMFDFMTPDIIEGEIVEAAPALTEPQTALSAHDDEGSDDR